MSDDSKAPEDLSTLGIDLSDMFRPAWTTETSDSSARLAAQFDEGDRPQRFEGRGGDRGRERGPGRDARSPRPDRGPRPDRPNRPEGRREGPGGSGTGSGQGAGQGRGPGGARPNTGPGASGGKSAPRGDGGRDRGDRRGPRDERDRRPEPPPKPALEGWKLQLVPEFAAIEGIAKQIRSRVKAYPLFELARLIVQLSDRYSVRLQAENEETPELFRAKADGSVWQTRKEAASHLLSKHLGKFYRKSSVTSEPPKGAFSVVAQCGMSGVLLGPPNHHEYMSRLISLHAERFRNMPFESYKSRIKMMRDEALIEQWKTEQSTKTVYIPLTEEVASQATEEILPASEPVAETSPADEEQAIVEGAAEIAAETPAEEKTEEAAPSEEVVSEAVTTTEEPAAEEASSEEGETAPDLDGNQSKSEEGLTLEQITVHFNEHHAEREIEALGRDITLGGGVALHGSTPLLRELLLQNLQEMDRFPLVLAQVLGKELTNRSLQLFKSHKKIINVSMARPRYLDRETTPIGESFRTILDYLEAHPNQHRDKQWSALLALRTENSESAPPAPVDTQVATATTTAEEASETIAESVVVIAEVEASTETTEAPTPTEVVPAAEVRKERAPSPVVDAETLKRREQALGADLLWLLHQGHVIDFAMGNLQAATRPVPKAPPTPKTPKTSSAPKASPVSTHKEETTTEAADLTLQGDAGEVLEGGAATHSTEAEQDIIHEPAEHHEPLEIPAGTILESSTPVDPGQALPN